MNIDDLKDAWSNDEPKGMQLPVSTAMLGKTNSAVERVRKNMKSEFIATLVSYVIIAIFLFGKPLTPFLFDIGCILFFTILVLNGYYFSRFYIFYKSIGSYSFNIKESVRKIAYELELNTEIYKTYNFSVAPLAVLTSLILYCGKWASSFIQQIFSSNSSLSPGNMLIVFLTILISFIITYICIGWHVRLQYGKYLAELKQVVDDLASEE
jgi:glucan phosphoethanolaminetransferase (alkaline phosphatase superfamily)